MTNKHERPIAITVFDQLPVSNNAEIKVEMTARPQPSKRDFEEKRGVLAWEDTLKPDEEKVDRLRLQDHLAGRQADHLRPLIECASCLRCLADARALDLPPPNCCPGPASPMVQEKRLPSPRASRDLVVEADPVMVRITAAQVIPARARTCSRAIAAAAGPRLAGNAAGERLARPSFLFRHGRAGGRPRQRAASALRPVDRDGLASVRRRSQGIPTWRDLFADVVRGEGFVW